MARLYELNPEWKDRPLYIVKFGRKDRLESLQGGKLYMNTFQYFIDLENRSGVKGQGDNFEGTAVVHNLTVTITNEETGEVVAEDLPVGRMTLRPNVLVNKPVFCATSLDGTLLEVVAESEDSFTAKLAFTEEQRERFVNDFGADHALLIPYDQFIQKVSDRLSALNIGFVDQKVQYDDFMVNSSVRLHSFAEPSLQAFFWKDKSLEYQNEFRLVVLEEVEAPYILDVGDLSACSKLLPIEHLFDGDFEFRFRNKK
jgi:hypothetical protein